MTTVTGDFAIDFSGLGDTNPYTNSNFTVEGASTFKIESGGLEPNTGGYTFFAYTDQSTVGTAYVVKMELNFSSTNDPATAAILDSSGNGYGLEIDGSNTRIRRYTSYAPVAFVNFTNVAYTAGDRFELHFEESTGALEAFKNDSSYSTGNDTTYTGTFRPGFLGTVNSNPSVASIASFAADNVGAAGPSITSTTDPAITGTAITTLGTDFEATQGTGGITQSIAGNTVALTETAWADTSATSTSATIESGPLKYGDNTLELTADGGGSDTITFEATPLANNDYVDLTSIATVGQLVTAAGTLAIGDQLRYQSFLYESAVITAYWVTVNADSTFTFDGATPDGSYTFDVRAWDDTDQTWGLVGVQTVTVGTPASGGISIKSNIKSSIKRSILQ